MYIDAVHNVRKGEVSVVERLPDGTRSFTDYPAEYTFYFSHPSGQHTSIYGDACKQFTTSDNRRFKKELMNKERETDRNGQPKHKIFESDINPIFRCLSTYYKDCEAPVPNIGFFDIETGFCHERGYAPATDPFNPVTAVSIYLSQAKRCVTLVLKPDSLGFEEAHNIATSFEDTILFDDEAAMLEAFLDVIDDTDILTGWNSTLFDIPYMVNRIRRLLGEKALTRLCLWNRQPMKRMIPRYGRDHESWDLVGRVHLDYLELYQKHNPKQMLSYRLDFIGEIEVGENKVAYTGTLDELYNKDFYKFIDYSRQDVFLLVKIDDKKKFIGLANQIAHVNGVLFKTTMGSVTLVEQAIINEMHSMGLVVPCRKNLEEEEHVEFEYEDDDGEAIEREKGPVVGAYVAKPKTGLHEHIGCVDINSLYPSAIRALNISPETIVGQLEPSYTKAEIKNRLNGGAKRSEAWDGLFSSLEFEMMMNQTDDKLTLKFDDGTEMTKTAKQIYEYIFNPKNKLCITANGTVFSTAKMGIIPQLLAKWYSQRQQMQGMKKLYGSLTGDGIELPEGLAASVDEMLSGE